MLRAIQELGVVEQQAGVRGLTIAGGVVIGLIAVCYFAVVMTYLTPPPPEKDFVTIGTIDFTKIGAGKMDYGNMTEGSGNVNNRRAPSPNPGNSRPKPNPPTKMPEPKSAPTPPAEEHLTQAEESPVKAQPSTPSDNRAPVADKPVPKSNNKPVDKNALFDEGGGAKQ